MLLFPQRERLCQSPGTTERATGKEPSLFLYTDVTPAASKLIG